VPSSAPASSLDLPATGVAPRTLRRVGRLGRSGRRVLSLYANLDPARLPTPQAREAELHALLGHAQREGAEIRPIRHLLARRPELVRRARALAVFAETDGETVEAIPLGVPVEPLAVVDGVPWLEPLAALVEPGEWGVAIVGRREARLLRGGPADLAEFARLEHPVHGRHAAGGWSQSRYARAIDRQVQEHVDAVAERLAAAHRAQPFDQLVVVAGDELWPQVRAALPAELRERWTGHVARDLPHAGIHEIEDLIEPLVAQSRVARERDLMERLRSALGTGLGAVVGLPEVLVLLEAGRVGTLLVAEGAHPDAGRCPRCGRFEPGPFATCLADGAELERVDGAEHVIAMAALRGVEVVIVRAEPEPLTEHDGVGALLRW
jgi:peptide subunit release factor 1 (eRF1)